MTRTLYSMMQDPDYEEHVLAEADRVQRLETDVKSVVGNDGAKKLCPCHDNWEVHVTETLEKMRRLDDNSDAALAAYLALRVEGNLLFDRAENAWYGQTTGLWHRMAPGSELHWLQSIALDMRDRLLGDRRAKYLATMRSNRKAKAVLESLATQPYIAAAGDIWDQDPYLLGTANAVVDLRTGQPVEASAEMHIRRQTSVPFVYWSEATRPTKFIEATQLILPDPEVWRYVMRALGYAMTGLTTEQVWFFFHGLGENGKTFLAETLRLILGNAEKGGYAYAGKPDTFTVASIKNPINYGAAMNAMRGARLVIVPEISKGELDTDLMKALSGGEPVTYRAPYARADVTYTPNAHLILYANSRPTITDSSHGNWRRLIEVPFNVVIPPERRVPNYWEVLYAEEGPGIQRLLIDAAGQYLREGLLPVPEAIRAATTDYRESSDPFAVWLNERTERTVRGGWRAQMAYLSYDRWCDENRERPMGSKDFYQRLGTLPGVVKQARNDGKYYLGIGPLDAE